MSEETAPCPHCGFAAPFTARTCPQCQRGMSGKALADAPPLSPDERARFALGTATPPETKKCPYCAEEIKWEANVCRFCQRDLIGASAGRVATSAPPQPKWNPGVAAVLSLVIPGAGQLYKGSVASGLVWFVAVVVGYFLMIVPGVVLHICCIVAAASGDPNK
jgi:hypothetical protein